MHLVGTSILGYYYDAGTHVYLKKKKAHFKIYVSNNFPKFSQTCRQLVCLPTAKHFNNEACLWRCSYSSLQYTWRFVSSGMTQYRSVDRYRRLGGTYCCCSHAIGRMLVFTKIQDVTLQMGLDVNFLVTAMRTTNRRTISGFDPSTIDLWSIQIIQLWFLSWNCYSLL